MEERIYYVYILTNPSKSVLYIGVTNNLRRRLAEHSENKGRPQTFAGRYFCYNLIYFEEHNDINRAIEREKEIKKWRREKKLILISAFNKEWHFLNHLFDEE